MVVPAGATPGVDVRGGGPGTRETDALRPENLVPTVHAVCLTGGSAYGLAAADGVAAWLEQRRLGFPVGLDDEVAPEQVVPVVPAAVIFDLGRGGRFANRPTPEFGWRAADRARGARTPPRRGRRRDRGRGGWAPGRRRHRRRATSTGSSSEPSPSSNASGRVIDPASGVPWCGDGFALRRPPAAERAALLAATAPPAPAAPEHRSTRRSGSWRRRPRSPRPRRRGWPIAAHDGLARAVRPAHSMFDGDTVFALATGRDPLPDAAARYRAAESRPGRLNQLLDAAAACFAAAVTDAVLAATSLGGPPAYRDVCPGAFRTTPHDG